MFLVPMAIIFVVVVCAVFLLPSGDTQDGEAEYNGKEGIVILTFAEPMPYAEWTADVYCDSSGAAGRTYVLKAAPVLLSSDGKTAELTDPSLINLDNVTYHVEVSAPIQAVHRISFQVTDHVFTGGEIAMLAAVALVFIVAVGFFLARRIIYGGKRSGHGPKGCIEHATVHRDVGGMRSARIVPIEVGYAELFP